MRKKGRHLSVALDTNMFSVAILQLRLCTSFTVLKGAISTDLVWVGLDTPLQDHET